MTSYAVSSRRSAAPGWPTWSAAPTANRARPHRGRRRPPSRPRPRCRCLPAPTPPWSSFAAAAVARRPPATPAGGRPWLRHRRAWIAFVDDDVRPGAGLERATGRRPDRTARHGRRQPGPTWRCRCRPGTGRPTRSGGPPAWSGRRGSPPTWPTGARCWRRPAGSTSASRGPSGRTPIWPYEPCGPASMSSGASAGHGAPGPRARRLARQYRRAGRQRRQRAAAGEVRSAPGGARSAPRPGPDRAAPARRRRGRRGGGRRSSAGRPAAGGRGGASVWACG